jgi:8-amino-7-oxononanoate synthase
MFSEYLQLLNEKGLLREIKDRDSSQGTRIRINGKEYLNFSSNDYLGLANNSFLIEAAQKTLGTFGVGAGASRLICGGSVLHNELERKIAEFKGVESALVLNTGYGANTGIISAIAGEGDAIFSDELNHASIIDGCRLSKAKTFVYSHKNTSELENLIKKTDAKKKIVVTDTVFSMDGDIAPIPEIFNICKGNNAILYLDDAHGTGVLGGGMGALSHFNIRPEQWIIQMGTFSKALGSFGAFAAGSKEVIDWIVNTARSFIFSTALPACIISASTSALEIVRKDKSLVDKLWRNRDRAVNGILGLGFDIMGSETPIIPLKMRTIDEALKKAKSLFDNGIFVPAIRPPSVKEPRLRITLTAAHTEDDIARLIKTLSL